MKFQKVVLLMVDHIHAGPKALQARYLLDVSETFHLHFTHDDVINQWWTHDDAVVSLGAGSFGINSLFYLIKLRLTC